MKNLHHHAAALSATAWIGALWAVGYLAVPVLFYAQPDKQLAGMLAGQMFVKSGYLGLICSLYLLGYFLYQQGRSAWCTGVFRLVAAMLFISLIIQFGIAPAMNDLKAQALPLDITKSELYGKFKMLHGISSIAYLIESLLGLIFIVKFRTLAPQKS